MKSNRLEGKRAVITGAAGGIAIATALSFVAEGATVTLADLDRAGVEKAVSKVISQGGKARAFVIDVTSRKEVESMMTGADTFMGGIDILVTCAGGYKAYAGFEDIQEADWDQVMNVNLKSVYLCCKAVLPYMKKEGWGRIINLGSLAGRSTSAGTSPAHYASAKAAVSMMTQYLAKDIGPYGITANTIAPGTTLTERVKNLLTPEKKELFTKACPLGRLAQPEEISDVITFLASNESRYITGATIDVNGGRLMLV
ncbi:MAG: short-chain dehydrogenase [Deltaproteobacteria bacterium]|nr:MAG: short-chain dehydrogenase [Deltaproteobacteria bacterium]